MILRILKVGHSLEKISELGIIKTNNINALLHFSRNNNTKLLLILMSVNYFPAKILGKNVLL